MFTAIVPMTGSYLFHHNVGLNEHISIQHSTVQYNLLLWHRGWNEANLKLGGGGGSLGGFAVPPHLPRDCSSYSRKNYIPQQAQRGNTGLLELQAHANSCNGTEDPKLNSQSHPTLPCIKIPPCENPNQMAAWSAWGHIAQLQDWGLLEKCGESREWDTW